ncbi:MAG: helix-hairpin-helix domain-containing protein [Pirellulales bacterium]
MPPPVPQPPISRRPLLRRADQATVAVLLACGLAVLAWKWVAWGVLQGRLIEIDREPPLRAAFIVDINRADWPELAQVPGVGETLARRIVERREQLGPYADNQELLEIQGIGPRTLDRMRPFLRGTPSGAAVAGGP